MELVNVRRLVQKQAITHWYQPIFNICTNEIIGYEALMRCKCPYNYSPLDIIANAKDQGCCTALDHLLLIKAQSVDGEIVVYPLFLNILPSTILSPGFLQWWDERGKIAPRVTLEISESEEIEDWHSFKRILGELKARGVKIALDDMGVDHSFMKSWIELNPDYVKLDRYYAQDLAIYDKKQRVVENFVRLFEGNTQLILEGIEDAEDLEAALKLGVQYAQGYFFIKPQPWENLPDLMDCMKQGRVFRLSAEML